MISRALDLGVERDQTADVGDGGPGFAVVLGGVDADRTAIVNDLQARPRGKTLLEVIAEVVSLPEDVGEVIIVEVHLVAQAGPVDALDLRRDQAEDHDHNDQEDAPRANARGASAFALRPHVLDQLDYAPEDQQRAPVIGKQMPHPGPRDHVQIAQQKDHAEHDQHQRAGKRTRAPRWNSRLNRASLNRTRLNRARHFSPPRKRAVAALTDPAAVERWAAPAAIRCGPGWKPCSAAVSPLRPPEYKRARYDPYLQHRWYAAAAERR